MATFTGTSGNNRILPGDVSAGVIVDPPGATPGGENDTIDGLAGNDQLDGGGGSDSINGGLDNDAVTGGSGDDTLLGDVGNDTLTGGTGFDSMTGGAGDDDYIVAATDGFDTINEVALGGLDEIRLASNIKQNTVSLQVVGNDLVISRGTLQLTVVGQFASGTGANARVERLVFGNGTVVSLTQPLNTWLQRTGGEAGDSLTGSGFDDTLSGRGGDDSVFGGNGNDSLNGNGGNDFVSGDVGNDRVLGEGGADNLNGGAGDDTLDGGTGSDTLSAGENNDELTGGAGDDFLSGGIGNDSYFVTALSGNDTVSEGLSGGTDSVEFTDATDAGDVVLSVIGSDLLIQTATSRITLSQQYASGTGTSARVERLVLGDGTVVNLRVVEDAWLTRSGTDENDNLSGSAFGDTLFGLEGADTLSGLDGDDSLDGGTGNDFITAGNGNDTLTGGIGSDILSGGANDDTYAFSGLAGLDTVSEFAGQGDDSIVFAPGTNLSDLTIRVVNDDLLIGAGADLITVADQYLSGTGTLARVEQLVLGNGQVVDLTTAIAAWRNQTGTASADFITGSIFNDTLSGGDGNDNLSGGTADDSLLGGDANDTLNGGIGNDTLEGNVGSDFLISGGGSNDFIFRPGDGSDSISGFADGLDSLVFGNFGTSFNSDAEIIAAAQQVGGNVVITLPNPDGVGSTVITLFTFQLANLDGGQIDFL